MSPGPRLWPVLLLASVANLGAAEPNWETLRGARLVPHPSNDGDSFRVAHGGKEFIFRLCYVDAAEDASHANLTQRLADQQRYWLIDRTRLFQIADEATRFVGEALQKPFTLHTAWEDARGQSPRGRYFAVVTTADGRDLADLLVEAGLVRIYGYMPRHPDGRDGTRVMADLRKLEAQALARKSGAWRWSPRRRPPARAPVGVTTPGASTDPTPRPTPRSSPRRSPADSLPAY